jgi:CubicO group peptidase (beta-lactamase class C family)
MMPPIVTPESVGFSSERLGRIDDWMADYVEAGKLPFAMTLIARHGKVAYFNMAGKADVEAGTPIAEDTIFRAYSMTKPITSAAVMMLYEEGLFQLDDPVADYIPAFAHMAVDIPGDEVRTVPARRPMTIHHLLTHTSGLTYGFSEGSRVGALYKEHETDFHPQSGSLEELCDRLATLPLVCHPGEAWNYSVSIDVLGRLVEVLSGQTFDRFLEDRIFAPLGMVDTSFQVPTAKLDRMAALYSATGDDAMKRADGSADSRYGREVTTFSGGGGLLSTIGDYYRFCEALRGGGVLDGVRILGRKTVEFMTRNHLPGDLSALGQDRFTEYKLDGVGFGLGFAVMLDPALAQMMTSPGEYTWGGMASTTFWVDPVEDLVGVYATQLMPSGFYSVRRELRALTYQALID